MRVLFMGTPEFAVPSLAALIEAGHEIVGVVCQPDRPAGRGQALHRPPVKELALARGLPVLQPEKLRDPTVLGKLGELAPEVIAVAAYGKILPRAVLDLPPRGAINVHGSLLPKYRGAAPVQRALAAGERITGVTIMQMNERMDAGDILLRRPVEIREDDTGQSLLDRLAEIGAAALVEALERLERGDLHPEPQREEESTLAPMIRKAEGEIDWSREALAIERAVRAFHPWPGTYTHLHGKLLKIHRAAVRPQPEPALPGTVLRASGHDLEVATGNDALALLELQLEGKKRLTAEQFLAGRLVREGDRLG